MGSKKKSNSRASQAAVTSAKKAEAAQVAEVASRGEIDDVGGNDDLASDEEEEPAERVGEAVGMDVESPPVTSPVVTRDVPGAPSASPGLVGSRQAMKGVIAERNAEAQAEAQVDQAAHLEEEARARGEESAGHSPAAESHIGDLAISALPASDSAGMSAEHDAGKLEGKDKESEDRVIPEIAQGADSYTSDSQERPAVSSIPLHQENGAEDETPETISAGDDTQIEDLMLPVSDAEGGADASVDKEVRSEFPTANGSAALAPPSLPKPEPVQGEEEESPDFAQTAGQDEFFSKIGGGELHPADTADIEGGSAGWTGSFPTPANAVISWPPTGSQSDDFFASFGASVSLDTPDSPMRSAVEPSLSPSHLDPATVEELIAADQQIFADEATAGHGRVSDSKKADYERNTASASLPQDNLEFTGQGTQGDSRFDGLGIEGDFQDNPVVKDAWAHNAGQGPDGPADQQTWETYGVGSSEQKLEPEPSPPMAAGRELASGFKGRGQNADHPIPVDPEPPQEITDEVDRLFGQAGLDQKEDLFGQLGTIDPDADAGPAVSKGGLFDQEVNEGETFPFELAQNPNREGDDLDKAAGMPFDSETLDLDAIGVPEGWLDDLGGWNWYTEDERLEVGREMARTVATDLPQPSDPAIKQGQASLAARHDPWTPPPIVYVPSNPPRSYAPAQSSSQQSPYAPPVPGQYGTAYSSPGYGSQTARKPYGQPSTHPANLPVHPSPPAPLLRTATPTAYDPPILRAAKPLHRAPSMAVMTTPFGMPAAPLPTPLEFGSPLAPPPPSRSVPPQSSASVSQSRPPIPSRNNSSALTAAVAPTAFDPPIMPLHRYASQARLRGSPQPISQYGGNPSTLPGSPQNQTSLRASNYAQPPGSNQPPYFASPPIGLPPSSIGFPSQIPQPPENSQGVREMLSPPQRMGYDHLAGHPEARPNMSSASASYKPSANQAPLGARTVSHQGLTSPSSISDRSRPLSPPKHSPSGDGRLNHVDQPDVDQPGWRSAYDRPVGSPPSRSLAISEPPDGQEPYSRSYEAGVQQQSAAGQSPLSQNHLRSRAPLRSDTYESPPRQVTSGFAAPTQMPQSRHQVDDIGHMGPWDMRGTHDTPTRHLDDAGEFPIAVHRNHGLAPENAGRQPSPQPDAPASPWRGDLKESEMDDLVMSSYDPDSSSPVSRLEDDDLRRGPARRVPCVSFGPRGQLVTAFQPEKEANTPSLTAARAYGETSQMQFVSVRTLSSVLLDSAPLSSPALQGPFLHDPISPKNVSNDKKRRDAILAYLDGQIEVTSAGIPYLTVKSADSLKRICAEAGLTLIRLIRLLVQHDGSLLTRDLDATLTVLAAVPGDGLHKAPDSLGPGDVGSDRQASSQTLDDLSHLVSRGRTADAASLAVDQGLWSHALILSSATGPDAWASTIQAFLTAALVNSLNRQSSIVIKASYALIANSDANLATKALQRNISDQEVLAAWPGIAATVLGNQRNQAGPLLSDLGDRLLFLQRVEAAHVCYLLSAASTGTPPRASATDKALPYGEMRDVYLADTLLLSEIVEYAYSTRSVPKGADVSPGIESLLPRKISKAVELYEVGRTDEAERYFESISAILRTMRNTAPARSDHLSRSLAGLRTILRGIDPTDTAGKRLVKPNLQNVGSWFEGRLTKFIAGEESEEAKPASDIAKGPAQQSAGDDAIGPFSHYSSIAPDAPLTGALARATSSYDLSNRYVENAPPVPRSGSAMAYRQPPAAPPSYRPASAMAYHPSPQALQAMTPMGPPSRSPVHPDSRHHEPAISSSRRGSSKAASTYEEDTSTPAQLAVPSWGQSYDFEEATDEPKSSEPSTSLPNDGFLNPMQSAMAGFGISAVPTASMPGSQPASGRFEEDEEDDDELGLGNSSSQSKAKGAPAVAPAPEEPAPSQDAYAPNPEEKKAPPEEEKKVDPAPTAASTGSWIGKFWGGSKSEKKPGPIKAKLGEETSMVFDPVQKRWVTKGAVGQAEAPKPPPPPPRSSTSSPAVQAKATAPLPQAPPPSSSRPFSSAPTPAGGSLPASPAQAPPAKQSGPPPPPSSGPPRPVSSMTAPPSRPSSSSATDPPLGDGLAPPPPRKAGAGGAKKNIRSRYVDVFQQP